jgi:imidazoleglycerol-phosphate dehydratase
MSGTQTGVRLELAQRGEADVATGLPMLDHLIRAIAVSAGLRLSLEVAPGTSDEEAAAAGRSLGEALAVSLRAPGAAGRGWAWLPVEEALAGAVLEVSERPLFASNADFSGERLGGLSRDVVANFLDQLAAGAGLNIHIRVLEGRDPEHVLLAIFKALGAALGQACRP